tara:strand:- start:511 stop:747 length:237 start_codon:yes stop_codon:yes gene_type:complete
MDMMTAASATEFRIKYKRVGHIGTDYHYYMAETAEQALQWQYWRMKAKAQELELLSVEKFDRFADKWIDRSEVLNEQV